MSTAPTAVIMFTAMKPPARWILPRTTRVATSGPAKTALVDGSELGLAIELRIRAL